MAMRGNGRRAVSRRSAIGAAGVAAFAAGLSGAASATTADAQRSSVLGIVGTWRMRFSPGPGRSSIQVIFVFIPGGVFLSLDSPVEPTADPNDAPDAIEYAGPNAGQWLQLATGEVRATALQLNYDHRAVVTSEEVSQYTLVYDGAGDTLSGTRDWRETAADGRLVSTASGTVQGTRVRVDA
jgi:hypothetical protein